MFGTRTNFNRFTRTVRKNRNKLALTAALSGAVLAGGLIAGMQLRKRKLRHAQEPYRFPWPQTPNSTAGADDYEPMGI